MYVTVFSVKRGLCVLVQTPSNHLVMIDCGRDPTAPEGSASNSPAKWIAQSKYKDIAARMDGKLLSWLVVTHPHDDHVEDIQNVISQLPPAILYRHKNVDWGQVLNPEDGDPSVNAKTYANWQVQYSRSILPPDLPNLGCQMQHFSLTREEAEETSSRLQHQLNNRSIVTVFSSVSGTLWKIVVMGDNELAGIRKMIELTPGFQDAIAKADVLVTSHHGYDSGYCPELFEVMGKPLVNISSTRSKDDYVSDAYGDMARGVVFENQPRKHLTTRRDGHIYFEMPAKGTSLIFYG